MTVDAKGANGHVHWIVATLRGKFDYDTLVNIDVIDQIPISKESDIEVTVEDISGAELDELSGKLLWKKQLIPSKTEKLSIAFTVKYPKKKKIKYKRNRVAAPKQFW